LSDHYEALRLQWQDKIANLDRAALMRRLPCLRQDPDGLHIIYLGSDHVITPSGAVFVSGCDRKISWNDEMNILTHLWYAKEETALTGDWVSFSDLPGASPYGPAFLRGNLQPFAAAFAGNGPKLEQALMALDGMKLPTGDVGYQINAFPYIPVRVLFWDGDEEFPAQVNLLFDRSACDYIHVESIVTIASALQHKLTTLAEL
jgi:hypothetical protein